MTVKLTKELRAILHFENITAKLEDSFWNDEVTANSNDFLYNHMQHQFMNDFVWKETKIFLNLYEHVPKSLCQQLCSFVMIPILRYLVSFLKGCVTVNNSPLFPVEMWLVLVLMFYHN